MSLTLIRGKQLLGSRDRSQTEFTLGPYVCQILTDERHGLGGHDWVTPTWLPTGATRNHTPNARPAWLHRFFDLRQFEDLLQAFDLTMPAGERPLDRQLDFGAVE